MIYLGDSVVRKTDTRLNKDDDFIVRLPGTRIEHVTKRVKGAHIIFSGSLQCLETGANDTGIRGG